MLFRSLRLGNVYGPRQDPHGEAGVVAIFSGKLIDGEPMKVFGDGLQTRDYVYVDDVVAAQVLASEAATGEMCVIGTGVETSTRRIFDLLAAQCGYERAPVMAPPRAGDIPRIALDAARARQVWGWAPQVSLEDGIARTVGWDGSVLAFARNTSGVWEQVTGGAPGFSNELRTVDASTWEFVSAQGETTRFTGASGVFRVAQTFAGGHQLSTVTWDGKQRISSVANEVGRAVTLAYADTVSSCPSQSWTGSGWAAVPAGLVCRITYPDGTSTDIGYVSGVAGSAQIGMVKDPGEVGTALGWTSRGRLVAERGPFENRVALTDPAAKAVVTSLEIGRANV